MFAEVKKFCFCVSLAVGTKIIGFFFTILAAMSTALFGVPAIVQMYTLPESTLDFYKIMAMTSALQFVTGILLIIGAFRNNTKLMRPWSVLSWWQSVALVLYTLLGSFVYMVVSTTKQDEEVGDDVEKTLVIVSYAAYALVIYYAASVVDSHCNELSDKRSLIQHEENLIENPAYAEEVNMI